MWNAFHGYVEVIPTYSSLTIAYNTATIDFESVCKYILDLWQRTDHVSPSEPAVIPVCYGGEFGPNLEYVSQYHDLTPSEEGNSRHWKS